MPVEIILLYRLYNTGRDSSQKIKGGCFYKEQITNTLNDDVAFRKKSYHRGVISSILMFTLGKFFFVSPRIAGISLRK